MTSTSLQLPTDYFRFRRRLLLGFLSVLCLSAAAMGWHIHAASVERQKTAQVQTQALAHAVGAHVADAVQMVDYAMAGFAKNFRDMPARQARPAAAIRQLLSNQAPASSADFGLMYIDAGGTAVASSENIAVQGVSFADRDYFLALAGAAAGSGLYIGEPVMAKVSGRRLLTLSRRVLDTQGRFAGVVVAMMDASHLAAIFENARFNKDMSITLIHTGGKIAARAPLFEQSFASSVFDSPLWAQVRAARSGSVQAASPVDGQPKLYTYQPLGARPLGVLTGISVQSLRLALWQDVLYDALRLGLLALVMLVSARFALRAYRNLEAARQALQESECRWRFALEGAGESVWEWNIETDAIRLSPRWQEMLGYSGEQIDTTMSGWCQHMHPDDQAQAQAERGALVNGAIPLYVNEYRVRCRDGSWKWILSRGMVMSRDDAGRALRAIGTHADITERKQAEQAQVQRVVEAAPDPMLLVGADGALLFANRAALTAFGYRLPQLAGLNLKQLLPWDGMHATAGAPQPGKRLQNALRRDGTEFPAEISLSPFQMNGQAVVIAHIRDLSESRQAAELLQQSYTQLRQLSDHQEQIKEAERKRIAQDIHDDLGQNLLALKMDVATLHARTALTHPLLHRRVGIVLDNVDGTIRSVKAIMNDLRPPLLELGLHPAVSWQLQQFKRVSGIDCELSAAAPQAEFGLDEGQTLAVFRILQESLANVAGHAQASAVRITLASYPGGFSMTVTDNGKGLQPGDCSRGNSFGLMGIRERAHSLGGALTIASGPGRGTVLSVSIPVGLAAAEA